MRLIIENTPQQVAQWAANYIIAQIKNKEQHTSSPFVLGLPTGSTPLETYKELIRRHKTGEVSFKNVITFNMDEYVGLPEEHPESYHSFMWNNFFKHVDIRPENVNILDGNADDLAKECADYEARIVEAGGIDLFMGGVGEEGVRNRGEDQSDGFRYARVEASGQQVRFVCQGAGAGEHAALCLRADPFFVALPREDPRNGRFREVELAGYVLE